MIRLRTVVALTTAVLVAACSSGATSISPIVAPTATPVPAPNVTVPVGSTASTQSLPAANGATATVSLAGAAGTPANASITITASATAPGGTTALASALRAPSGVRKTSAVTRVPLAYYTFVPNVDIQLAGFPAFTVAFPAGVLPAGATIHEAFLDASTSQPVYTLDIATGANGATFTATANAPKLLAGKTYVFAFYYETGSNATPAPSASPTSSPAASPTPPPVASDITVPASISTQPVGQASITDIGYFSGFDGTHLFARGGIASFNGGAPSLITDCRLTVSNTDVKLEGGGQTVVAPLISSNPNVKTTVFGFSDPFHLGGSELLSFYDANGSGINVGVFAGHVNAVGGGKTGTSISCNAAYASNGITDRSLDTVTFSAAALGAFSAKAGNSASYTQAKIAPADLGGANGTAVLGSGILAANGSAHIVTDCKIDVSGGTITLSGGGTFSSTATFTGAATDKVQVVSGQGSPTQFAFMPANGRVVMIANSFGFVAKANSNLPDGTSLSCPAT